jgi:hypothetical protein
MMEILGRSTTLASTYDSDKFMSEVIKATLNALHVVAPSQVAGTIARYHVSDQSNSRTRIELPTGAKAIRIFYSARKAAGVADATGEALKVVFNIANTTTAGTALAESASSPGASITGVSYLVVPIDSSYEAAFPDTDDRLYYVDFLSAVAETGDSDVIVEVTL